ncbi:MAG: D-alanine--D-alanine ligase, partial [Lysobacteraceae bacterium]
MNAYQFAAPRTADPKAFGRVAVLLGGTSSEREVSLDSGRNVLEALRARGVDATAVDGIPALAEALVQKKFDRVFNILHGHKGGGEDGIVQGLLESFGVPYTGSGVLGSALGMDKVRTKQVWLSLGLPTPRYARLLPGDPVSGTGQAVHAAAATLGLPVIVKPANEGSSVGVTRVFQDADLQAAVELAARYDGELLMEQMIVGDELTVAILGDVALPSIRIVPKGEWYDYHAKYQAEDTQYLCPGLEG